MDFESIWWLLIKNFGNDIGLVVNESVILTINGFLIRNLDPLQRHYYEIIKENVHCKLYFDLEYLIDYNSKANGESMVSILKQFVCEELRAKHQIEVSEEDIIDLCSTSPPKFSRHLIFHILDIAFENNLQVGCFVRNLINRMKKILQNPSDPKYPEISQLVIARENGTKDFFIDEGVYTRNRLFRVYLSSKFGKNVSLERASSNKHAEYRQERFFQNSLVSMIGFSNQKEKELRVITCQLDTKLSSEILSFSLFSPAIYPSKISSYPSVGGEKCPFPRIDSFILSQVNKTGSAFFRSVLYYPSAKKIVYHIGSNRYCENIGRYHKSNHVLYVAELELGCFFQKCLDPDCQKIGFRSIPKPIPVEINPFAPTSQKKEIDFDSCFTVPDEDLLKAIEDNPLAWVERK